MTVPQATLDAARVLLAQLGVSPADLTGGPIAVPTFIQYLARVKKGIAPRTLATYQTHYTWIENNWGSKRLDGVTRADIETTADAVRANSRINRSSRGGRGAAENFLAAVRRIYRLAEKDGYIRKSENPAIEVAKPARLASRRYAIPAPRLAEISTVAATSSNDPALDTLILRLHVETACRRGGALALRPYDLDQEQCLIHLREKGETDRWQPVSPTLMRHLVHHAETRGAPHDGQLLRHKNGRPITSRRYDGMWARIGKQLPWVDKQQVTTHWLRHTTLTWVERNYGFAVARSFGGHILRGTGPTGIYVGATLQEIAAALAHMTGEPHPLANGA